MPVNVLLRTVVTLVGATALYIVYYKTSHLFLGTQKGFSHPQQFPMIPMIWLVNIWLVHHWFMDNWPAWKMVPKTAAEIEADHAAHKAAIGEVRWTPKFGAGLGAGVVMGVVFYFVTVWALPAVYEYINIIPGK
jgi:AAT family amino acid transporter